MLAGAFEVIGGFVVAVADGLVVGCKFEAPQAAQLLGAGAEVGDDLG